METKAKNKILYILMAVLVIMNLITLGSLWMFRVKERLPLQQSPPPLVKEFLEKELNFNKEQSEKFDKLKLEHHSNSKKIIDEIALKKESLFDLIKENSGDDPKVIKIADEIGTKQKELDLVTYNHFRDIRNLCDEKQKVKFDLIVNDITKMIGLQNPQGRPPGPPGPPEGPPPKK